MLQTGSVADQIVAEYNNAKELSTSTQHQRHTDERLRHSITTAKLSKRNFFVVIFNFTSKKVLWFSCFQKDQQNPSHQMCCIKRRTLDLSRDYGLQNICIKMLYNESFPHLNEFLTDFTEK